MTRLAADVAGLVAVWAVGNCMRSGPARMTLRRLWAGPCQMAHNAAIVASLCTRTTAIRYCACATSAAATSLSSTTACRLLLLDLNTAVLAVSRGSCGGVEIAGFPAPHPPESGPSRHSGCEQPPG
eukprot:scaffold283268_cov33-Tisochrysis_lutea.AAC.2